MSCSEDAASEIIKSVRENASYVTLKAEENLEKHAKVLKAYCDIAQERGLAAIASTCWPRYRLEMSMVPCLSFAQLNDMGIVTTCEGDVLSAVSMLALKYIADCTPILMDLSSFDVTDDSIFLWHCGVGSKFYSKNGKVAVEQHFNPGPYSPETGWATQAPVANMEFAAGRASIMRFTNECTAAFIMGGDFFEGKASHDGSRGWMKNLTFNGKPIATADLVNTILVNGFHHHYPIIHGDLTSELMDFMYWMDLKLLKKHPYEHYNSPESEV
jgi:L-fucose isomerase-like protein